MERSRVSFPRNNSDALPPDPRSADPETIEEAATRVLFSTNLEEKLRPARVISSRGNEESSRPLSSEGLEPGRPDHLRFAGSDAKRPALPSSPGLVDDRNRGVLLHFFANHELLAAELMALALLRFPDAPGAFRSGLMQTLAEEQRHTRWYLNRLEKCGVEFGEYPLNRFFWDAVSTMTCPLDYVSRLCLTFEQANLDYARHYSEILAEAGDDHSAAILRRIYEDEISHVGYGLHWFRKWKSPDSTDWEALEKNLVFPLSPSRAKGNGTRFNDEGRKEAGFDDDYIRQLALFERSKGRTPNVFYFNPEAENRIGALPAPYHPTKRVLSIVEDLELLAAFLARRDDVALLRALPSSAHIEKLRRAGLVLPELEALTSSGCLDEDSLMKKRKIHRFRPWAVAPDLPETFPEFAPGITGDRSSSWLESDRELFSKVVQAQRFRSWFGESIPVRSDEDVRLALDHFGSPETRPLFLKRAFSTAGQGARQISLGELRSLASRPLGESILREGGFLLEPLHERVFDFSIQLEAHSDGIRNLGPVEQIIAPTGGYRGSICVPKFCSGLDPEIARFLMTKALPRYEEGSEFLEEIHRWAKEHHYEGPIGIDSYLYRSESGELSHRVACELNVRYTMGRVAWELRKQIAPGHGLRFDIGKATNLAPGDDSARIENESMIGGSLILTEALDQSHFAAKISVAKHRKDLYLS